MGLAALRIVLYSGGDPVLMKVLVETLDVTTLLLGTLLPLLPVLFWLALQPLIADASLARQLLEKGVPRRRWWLGLVLLLAAFYLLVGPWPSTIQGFGYLALAMLAGALTVSLVAVIRARRAGVSWRDAVRIRLTWGRSPVVGDVSHLLLVPVLMVVLVFAMPQGFWLPRESITADGEAVTGYTLQSKDGWTTIMTEERAVVRYPSASVTVREVCDQGEYKSLMTVLLNLDAPPKVACG